jgi:hypothetical protein
MKGAFSDRGIGGSLGQRPLGMHFEHGVRWDRVAQCDPHVVQQQIAVDTFDGTHPLGVARGAPHYVKERATLQGQGSPLGVGGQLGLGLRQRGHIGRKRHALSRRQIETARPILGPHRVGRLRAARHLQAQLVRAGADYKIMKPLRLPAPAKTTHLRQADRREASGNVPLLRLRGGHGLERGGRNLVDRPGSEQRGGIPLTQAERDELGPFHFRLGLA